MRRVNSQLPQELAQARERLRSIAAMRAQTDANADRVRAIEQLARLAEERLLGADLALMRRVLELLEVRVTIMSHGARGSRSGPVGPVRLRVEGSVAHDVLLASAERDWHPEIVATARG